jgi:hypothetical protein
LLLDSSAGIGTTGMESGTRPVEASAMVEMVDYKPLLLVEAPLPLAEQSLHDDEAHRVWDAVSSIGVAETIITSSLIGGLWLGARALLDRPSASPGEASVDRPDQTLGDEKHLVSMLLRSPVLERLSFEEARKSGRRFPPGHPLPGRFYRQHPLAASRPDKTSVFIPIEMFDDLLLREREAELIRVLTDLGASEVTIVEDESNTAAASASAKVEATVGGGVKAGLSGESSSSDSRVRIFKFVGRPWSEGFEFDSSPFGWLDFEPSWDAIAYARVRGGCTEATIRLTRETSFSLGAKLGVTGLVERLAAVSAEVEGRRTKAAEYSVRVQFPGWAEAAAE